MILSYHPIFEGDKNLICAGREPSAEDLAALGEADVVILSQGCYEPLYKMARNHCRNVFPNFDAKFKYPGKTGQIRLFKKTKTAHPQTEIFSTVNPFFNPAAVLIKKPFFAFPFVFKFDWGGEGNTVYLITSHKDFVEILHRARRFEQTGQKGFLFQEYIPAQNRSLRVVVIGQDFYSYWRVKKNPKQFQSSLAAGGIVDRKSDPELQESGILAANAFCEKTGINLAGFDYLFSSEAGEKKPLLLEINYFFGRQGLGGSEKYYMLLISAIEKWLKTLNY